MKAYDIKIRLDKVKPNCWRDLIIPAGIDFYDLSFICQVVYGFRYDDYKFIFKDFNLNIEGLGNEIPLIFIRELDDYYLSFIYNLGEAFEIDYFFEKYKKIKLEVYTRDIWNITIEVKKIVESEVSYPIIKRYKGDYNPLERSCDRGDFIDFLYLLDHLEEKDDEYYNKAVSFWDDFEKFDIEKTQKLLNDYFNNDSKEDIISNEDTSGEDDSVNILPEGPSTITNIDSTLYEATLIGENELGSVYLHKPFLDSERNIKIAFITGLNPIESKAYRAVFEAINSHLGISFTSFHIFHINYNESSNKDNQKEIGEKLANKYIIPNILENEYELVFDVHSNIQEVVDETTPLDFIFAIDDSDKSKNYMDEISSIMLKEYKPSSYVAPNYIQSLIDNNQSAIYFETYSYEPLSLTYTIVCNLMEAIDKKVFEERVNNRR